MSTQTHRECKLHTAAAETHGIDTQGARAACGSGARAAHLHGDEKYREEEEASTGLQQPLEPTRAVKCQLPLDAGSSTACSNMHESQLSNLQNGNERSKREGNQ